MDKIFIGMLLIWLDLDFPLGSGVIGLLPDFAGYILVMRGIYSLEKNIRYLVKVWPWTVIMAAYTGILYGLRLFGLLAGDPFVLWVLELAAMAAALAVQYGILSGIRKMERQEGWDLQSDRLRILWLALAMVQGMGAVLSWVPTVGIILTVAGWIVAICFLAAFYRTKTRYQKNTH